MLNITNEDCMDLMARYPDGHFDLAIVDPPYGIGASNKRSYHSNAFQIYTPKKWDNNVPEKWYWNELLRVSKNQIVWGANYFTDFLPISRKWIVWDKMQPEGIDQAMFELAWNSQQNIQARIYRQSTASNVNRAIYRHSAKKYERIHPTQKPVALYKWLLHNYAKPGDKILDTHLGSGSIAIACHDYGFDLTGCELDKEYFDAAMKRILAHTAQTKLF